MYGKPINHAIAKKTIALMYGDMYPAFTAASKRVGHVAVVTMLRAIGERERRGQKVNTSLLAMQWQSELEQPVDYGLIELMIAMRDRMSRNWLLHLRVVYGMKRAGIFPPTEVAA